jgi:predicted RNA-binding Zn-ribbon protein involved in translation (DUF1610 family)
MRLALVVLVMLSGMALLGPALLFLWPVVFLGPLAWLILWHTRNFAYRCRNCGNSFEISFWHNALTPHSPDGKGGGVKYVKCPSCGKWSLAQVLRIERAD